MTLALWLKSPFFSYWGSSKHEIIWGILWVDSETHFWKCPLHNLKKMIIPRIMLSPESFNKYLRWWFKYHEKCEYNHVVYAFLIAINNNSELSWN